MEVRPRDRLTFEVTGDSGRTHLVDLLEHGGIGACSCEHFEHRIRPILEGNRQRAFGPASLRCKHVQAARSFLVDALIRDISRRHDGDQARQVG